ncbi:hypothetical protein PSTG_02637 [Puccinia striiformis f. sp. tritici PST-78]|uniref:DEAD/DEAH-box helicase domain-containing protein n=1 Tax=Puccinia striiformis f. sp. tritici PST-78 TaxID=1165861 RepID=A0A0L0VZ43_9BASI|nr:hypothetical protein PSTG_02637 [Puccinia striiformis f. sp. tritici PST-78]
MNRVSKTPPPPINPPRVTWASAGITVLAKIAKKNDDALRREISEISQFRYGQDAKPLQIDAVVNLVRGRNTFLLAGTGYGKSRIAELYFRTLPVREKPVIIVLVPLDSLGHNHVRVLNDPHWRYVEGARKDTWGAGETSRTRVWITSSAEWRALVSLNTTEE